MSNLRAGTPSRTKRKRISPLAILIGLLAAALVIGIIIGFILGRVTAPKDTDTPTVPAASSMDTDPADQENADASASVASVSVEPEDVTPPAPVPAEPTGIKVCIDPGHGGNDGGTSDGDRLEKDDNLRLALVLKEQMELKGIEVVMTRDEDKYISLDERCSIANSSGADYLISLHRNSAGGVASGVEIWRSHRADDEAIYFADKIHDALLSVSDFHDRGVRIGSQSSENFDLQMNRNTDMPSVLIELGFIEMAEDNELYDNHLVEHCQAMAQAVLDTYADKH